MRVLQCVYFRYINENVSLRLFFKNRARARAPSTELRIYLGW